VPKIFDGSHDWIDLEHNRQVVQVGKPPFVAHLEINDCVRGSAGDLSRPQAVYDRTDSVLVRRWETMTGNEGEHAQRTQQRSKHGWAALTIGYLVVAIGGLIILRASFNRLNFMGIGWLIALAAIPLLPWGLPRLPGFIKTISPYVRGVGIGTVHIDLRGAAERLNEIVVSTSGGIVPHNVGSEFNVLASQYAPRLKPRMNRRSPGTQWLIRNWYASCSSVRIPAPNALPLKREIRWASGVHAPAAEKAPTPGL
jgi:hypothetical protein